MITALSQRDDFLLLRKTGINRRSGPLRARVVVDSGAPVLSGTPALKLGFTIGRTFGNAVKRNRMRRRLRHCVAEVAAANQVDSSHVLIGANPTALDTSHPDLLAHCRRLMGAGQ